LDLDVYLGPYPLERYDVWKEVSGYISEKTLSKLNPIENQLYHSDQEYFNKQSNV
jgi:hypothetical protein